MNKPVPFLLQVARTYIEKEGDRLQEYCFVFPNRRSSLFFRRYLLQEMSRPMFCPALTTISDLFVSLSELRLADDIVLLYQLFLSYRSCVPGFDETFDDFIRWGDVLKGDFDDIDKYMADAAGLFENLSDLKKLEDGTFSYLNASQKEAIERFWGAVRKGKPNSDSFLGVWGCLRNVYEDYRKRLAEQGFGYEGMICRQVAEGINSADIGWKRIVFIGLNALSTCESVLMDALKKDGKADFYWDYCGDLLKDSENRASLFMEENLRRYPSLYPLAQETSSLPEVSVIGVPSAVGQAKCLPLILSGLDRESLSELSTCVVLPDPSLLHPVLTSVPDDIRTINVTMGYPLKESGVSFFMAEVAALQTGIRLKGGRNTFYHVPVMDILNNPFVRKTSGEAAAVIRKEMLEGHLLYVTAELFSGDELLETIFNPDIGDNPAQYLSRVLEKIRAVAGDLDREYIYHYLTNIRKLDSLHLELKLSTWFSVLDRLVRTISVPLSGEPLSGLQIMGPLETRAIDFKYLIILSMNEGIFPSRGVKDSMIPYNLRRGFGLPTYEVQDAIGAYHFYRSIARAEKVFFLYDTRTQSAGGAEVSRYIKQLKYHHRLNIRSMTASYPMSESSVSDSVPPVVKSREMISILSEVNYSATSLISYLTCPIQFYYAQVCGFREDKQLEDSIDAGTFGSVFHKVMELLHKPFEGKVIDAAGVQQMRHRTQEAISSAFEDVIGVTEIKGRNLIVAELMDRYAGRVLDTDVVNLPIRYLKSEKRVMKSVTTPSGVTLNVKGTIDRFDRAAGVFRIIDYKTGGRIHVDFESVEELFKGGEKFPKTAFQLLFYLFLLRENGDVTSQDAVRMEVVHTAALFRGDKCQMAVSEDDYQEFRIRTLGLLDEIMDQEMPFTASASDKNCTYCQFRILCNR